MNLRQYREEKNITLKEASIITNVPLRTYIRYENDESYGNDLKRKQMLELFEEKFQINEEKGILSINEIRKIVTDIFLKYKNNIDFCYLFGSYAKGVARENSDVDLCVSTDLKGMQFVGLIEEVRHSLNKKVDLIRLSDLSNNIELINEIMKDGIKVYEYKN